MDNLSVTMGQETINLWIKPTYPVSLVDGLFTISVPNIFFSKRIEENYVIKDIYFEDNGKNFHYFEKVKLSTLEQIKALAESCGFEVVKIWGNYNLENFDRETSPRCIFQFKNSKTK